MNRMPDGGGRDLPTEQWRRLEELLAIALELPAEARRELLDRECAGEIALREELDSLIAAHEKAGPLDRPIARLTGSSAPPVGAEPPLGAVVSHYELQERLGSGGMGVVYRARDLRLDRVVALKFLLPALSEDAQAKRRFLREARAAATCRRG